MKPRLTRDSPVLSIKTTPEQRASIVAAAAREGLAPSTWARELALTVAAAGMPLHRLTELLSAPQPVQPVRLGVGAARVREVPCLHPSHLVTRYLSFSRCACGETFFRRGT